MPYPGFGNLLQNIANPKVADAVGANLKANKSRAATEGTQAATANLKAETTATGLKNKTQLVQALMTDSAAMMLMDDESQLTFLKNLEKKYSSSPGLVQHIKTVASKSYKDRLIGAATALETGTKMGFFGAKSSSTDSRSTAEKNADAQGLIKGTESYNAYIERATIAEGRDNRTPSQKNAEASGFKPGSSNYQEFIIKDTLPGDIETRTPLMKNLEAAGYSPNTENYKLKMRQEINKGSKGSDKTTLMKDAEAAGFKPGTIEYNKFITNSYEKNNKDTPLMKNAAAAGFKKGTPEYEKAIVDSLSPLQGTIPTGWQLNRESGKMEPIPNGPVDIAQRETMEKISLAVVTAKAKTRNITNKVEDAIRDSGVFTSGFFGSITSLVPGTKAYNLGQTLDTIVANLGFDKLDEMRQMSPTGGALGQVSERELAQLERAVQSLKQAQTPAQLIKNLNAVKTHYQNWQRNQEKYQRGRAKAMNRDFDKHMGTDGSGKADTEAQSIIDRVLQGQ